MNCQALRSYVRFLLESGLTAGYATLLAGGAAGDFSTMTFEERLAVAEIVADEANGRVPLAFGGQTTSTLELVRARQGRAIDGLRLHAGLVPLLLHPYGGRFRGIRDALPRKRRPTSASSSTTRSGPRPVFPSRWSSVWRDIPNIVGLKWATPRTDAMEFEDVTSHFSERFTIIDNNLFFPYSAMPALGARAFEVHLCNYWPRVGHQAHR